MSADQLPHNHGENINYILKDLPENANFSAVSGLFSSLADANRIKLFWYLCHMEECVINLSALMHMSSPALSHHLKILRENGLITSRRAGKEMYYKAANTEEVRLLHHMIELLIDITCPEQETEAKREERRVKSAFFSCTGRAYSGTAGGRLLYSSWGSGTHSFLQFR